MNALRYSWVLGVVGVAGIITFGSIWFVSGSVGAFAQVSGLLGALALGAYAFIDRDRLAEGTSAKEALASLSMVLVLVLAVLLGGLTVSLTATWDQTADLTQSGVYTLSQRTRSVLDGLESEVTLYGVFRKGSPQREDFERLSDLYDRASSNVTVEIIDPLTEPSRAGALVKSTGNAELDRLSESGTVLIAQGSRRRRLESRFDEEAVTNALVKLTSGSDLRVCWSVGHDERDPDDDQTLPGWGVTIVRLEDRNAVVTEQRIVTDGVDRACDVLAIIGPQRDFLSTELEAVAAYVAEGGRVLVALDSAAEGVALPTLSEDLERYGVLVGNDVIVENSEANVMEGPGREPLYIYGPPNFARHPIVDVDTVITPRWPRSVRASEGAVGVQVLEIASSSDLSWAETNLDLQAATLPEPNPGEILGPVSFIAISEVADPAALGVAAALPAEPLVTPATDDTDAGVDPVLDGTPTTPVALRGAGSLVPEDLQPKPGGRVLVIGDSDLGSNPLSSYFGNGDVVLNAITYLLDEEDQLGAGPKANEELVLRGWQAALLYLFGPILFPLLTVLTGLGLLLRRRFL